MRRFSGLHSSRASVGVGLVVLVVCVLGAAGTRLLASPPPAPNPFDVIIATLGQLQAALTTHAEEPAASWHRTLSSDARFLTLENMNNEAVLDRETWLVWERSPGTVGRSRFNANIYCMERKTGGRMGWRLPRAEELFSLVDPALVPATPTLPAPAALPEGHPFVNVAGTFMSASVLGAPFGPGDGGFVSVSMQFGFIQTLSSNFSSDRTWCVRSPAGTDLAF